MNLLKKNPDVLECLASLSNDEVFTPPKIANQMLDLLPQSIWSNPEAKFLDPACKSGVFLREIAKRLMRGLENVIPDDDARRNHIFSKQLYAVAITELTSLISRRTVYCSKQANGEFSICSQFKTPQGNIIFNSMKHTWSDGKCSFCGANKTNYDRDAELEAHAYQFIHTINPGEIFNMKFDVVIGNPPYQMSDGGNGVSATPIFQHFVNQAKKLNPRYLTMIIPARWYAGGKGLDGFREQMLTDNHIRTLVDFESSKDCFDGVDIAGGVCYFLWERDNPGLCEITNVIKDQKYTSTRPLDEFPILIRSNLAVNIVHKIMSSNPDVISNHAYPRNPFGFSTNYRGRTQKLDMDVEILTSVGFQYVRRQDVTKNADIIDSYKVLIGRLVPSNGELNVDPKDGYKVITDTRIIGPGQINTETYLDIGVFKTEKEAINFEKYLKTKFLRFLLKQAISSLNVTRECFRFVPYLDFTQEWTDEKLYENYGLSESESTYIESIMRRMD